MRCSICETEFDPDESKFMPFCSERCKLVDLNRWLDEGYGMPYDVEDEKEFRPGDSREDDAV